MKRGDAVQAVNTWFIDERLAGRPVKKSDVLAKIKEFKDPNDLTSNNFIYREWREQNDIGVRKKTDKRTVSAALYAEIEAFRATFDTHWNALRGGRKINWFNVDETPLYFAKEGQVTLETRGTKHVTIAGSEDRNRVTLVLGAFANGTRAKPALILRASKRKPAGLVCDIPERMVFRQANAWNDADTYTKILQIWFREHNRAGSNKPKITHLLHDNVGFHKSQEVMDLCSQHGVVLKTGPANATEIWQPLDRGIIANFKHHFETVRARTHRLRGVAWNVEADLPLVVDGAWKEVPSTVIIACFESALKSTQGANAEVVDKLVNRVWTDATQDDDEDEVNFVCEFKNFRTSPTARREE